MKKILSILLLSLFCVYSFTFKTHYCYYSGTHENVHTSLDHNGNIQYCYNHKTNGRFHGDCSGHIKDVAEKTELAGHNLFPSHYYCHDIVKNAQIYETKILPLKNYSISAFIAPPVIKIPTPDFSSCDWNVPEICCRGGPPPLVISLRGPPLS